jgi:hypothetical protein
MNDKQPYNDQELSDIYQHGERQSSPTALDERILAMAEASAPRSALVMPRWLMTVSAAAVAGLAILLVADYPTLESPMPAVQSPQSPGTHEPLHESAPAADAKLKIRATMSTRKLESDEEKEEQGSAGFAELQASSMADADLDRPADLSQLLVLLDTAILEDNGEQIRALLEQLDHGYPEYELPAGLAEKLRPWLAD